ncbi:MAG: MFS transporter [Actinomycetota bacterium]|nr:MFS transporter [Actinomycetota bacterium]
MKAPLVASYAFAVAMLGVTLPTPLYPQYQQRFGFSTMMITVIYAAYAVGVIVTLVLFGNSSDHYGRKPVLLIGLGFSAASAVCFFLAKGLPMIFTGRVLSGLSAGLFTGTASTYVIDLATHADQRRATLLAAAANTGGIGAGPLLAGLTSQYLPAPLRTAYLADLVLVAVGMAGLLRLPETVPTRDYRMDLHPRLGIPARESRMFLRAVIAGVAGYAVYGYFLAIIPTALENQFNLHNHALVGAIIFMLFGAATLGQLATPVIGNHRALGIGCLILILGMGLLAAALAKSSVALLATGAVIAGAGQGLSFRAALGLVRNLSPQDQTGRVASMYFVVLYTAISTAVIAIGLAAHPFGLRLTGIATAVIVAVLAAICTVSLAAV